MQTTFLTFLLLSLPLYVSAIAGNFSVFPTGASGATSPIITTSPSLTQASNVSANCNPCQIMVAWTSISRVYWYGATVDLTLNTVSVFVTQYNNTAITTSSTIYGNVGTVNASTVTEAQSLAAVLFGEFAEGSLEYGSTSIRLGNATEGMVDGPSTIPYPTPYLAIDGFQYVSATAQVDGCPPGQLKGSSDTCTCIMDTLLFAFVNQAEGYPLQGWGPGQGYPSQTSVVVPLTSTYYEALALESLNLSNTQDFDGVMESNTGTVNTASLLNFLSAASVFKSYPALSSCAIYNSFNGPPVVMIPASALTTTVKTTIAGIGGYNSLTAKPASPVKATFVPQTAETPSSTPVVPAGQTSGPTPEVISPGIGGTPTNVPELSDSPEASSPTFPEVPNNSPDLPGLQPMAGPSVTAVHQTQLPVVGTNTQILAVLTPAQGETNSVLLVPVLTFDGSTYQANQASQFFIDGQTVAPGGVITVSGTPIAIGTDVSIAVVGGSTQSLSSTIATPKPLLTFAGSTYTADDSNNFVIDGKTLTKGGTVNIDNTQLSLDQAGTGVVIGTSTQALAFPSITAAAGPIITFGGSTYTIGSSSDFILNGQTLSKGGIITIDGTKLSYGEAGTDVVIGTSTQLLSLPTITAVAEQILTFGGSTYIADFSSDFIIDGQTLAKGQVITIDGTRLSYNQAGTDVVIGTSTQELSTTNIIAAQEKPAITIDGSTFYADPSSDFIIDGQTLTKGGVITVQGTPISYGVSGTDVVVGTSTEAVGLGGYIMSGFGGGLSTSGASVPFTGDAATKTPTPWNLRFMLGVVTVFLVFGM